MKFSAATLTVFSAVLTGVTAQSALLEAEALFPSCALGCMIKLIPQSSCNITDLPCLCTNRPLNANITSCARSACTIKELLTTQNVSRTMCGAEIRDRTNQVSYVGVVGGIAAFVAFLLRIWSRLLKSTTGQQSFGFDDAMICLLMVLAAPPTVFSFVLAKNGLGKDIWTLPFDDITRLLYYYFLGENFYLVAISVNKIVILIFIFRIFGDGGFRKYIFIVMALCTCYGISFLFATTFQCTPINYSWQNWDGEHRGRCNNVRLQGWMSAAMNILLDVTVIVLPMPRLFKLNISWKRKAMIIGMFSLGVLVTVISVVRLRSLIQFANSENVTWDYVPAAYWSTIELHVGIICACLPAIRALLARFFPRVFNSTVGQSATDSEMARRYTSHQVQESVTFTHSANKEPFSTSSDPYSSTERFAGIPLADVESQHRKTPSQGEPSWPL